MGGYDKNPGKIGAGAWVALVLVAGAGVAGWKLYQRRVVGEGNAKLECSLRIEKLQADCDATFLRYPAGDTTDVRLDFDGQTLEEPGSFSWPELARLAGQPATDPPPLNQPLRWRVPLKLVQELKPTMGDFIVHGRLFWAGRQQDLARFSTKVVFNPK